MNTVKKYLNRYFVDALSAMAYGMFASLIIGVILSQFAKIPILGFLSVYGEILGASSPVIGCAVGAAIGYSLDCDKLVVFSLAGVGAVGYKLGGPVASYVASIAGAEVGQLISGHTKIDIVAVPFVVLTVGGIIAQVIGVPISSFMTFLGSVINEATYLRPVTMGITVSVLMGIFLTAPISSAAIAISLGLTGTAAGAATVGCCVHMLGFAITSIRDNGLEGLLSQGLGTSMLQVGNIMKKPLIIVPEIVVSAVLGPVATTLVIIENTPWGAGMGTSGLVGIIGAYEAMLASGEPTSLVMVKIGAVLIIAPILLTYLVGELMRAKGYIKKGDMKIISK